ncbi:MAG: hypothetical protein ACYC4Q_01665, partial [Victivallaceae bacterium]
DSKMSNGEEKQTEQLAVRLVPPSGDQTRPTCPTSPMTPAAERSLPQADSKMSNEGSPAALPAPAGAGSSEAA